MCARFWVTASVQRNTLHLLSLQFSRPPLLRPLFSHPSPQLFSTPHILPLSAPNPSLCMDGRTDGRMDGCVAGTEERWICRSTSSLLWYRTPAHSCHHCRSKQIAFTLCHFTRLNSSLFLFLGYFSFISLKLPSLSLSFSLSPEFHFSSYLWHISNSGVTLTINLTIYIEQGSREKFVIKKCIDPVYYSVVCCECWNTVT